MQELNFTEPCQRRVEPRRKKINLTLDPKILDLFSSKMVERGEKNKSALFDFLMTCWIYSEGEECNPACPYSKEDSEIGTVSTISANSTNFECAKTIINEQPPKPIKQASKPITQAPEEHLKCNGA